MTYTTLITVSELRDHLLDPDWCVLDCRHELADFSAGRHAYEAGHIPGAQFADTETELSGARTGRNGRHPLPQRAALERQFGHWGIHAHTQIVAYDAHGGHYAARLWWLARWLGHTHVAVLDGGWPAWKAQTSLSSSEPAPRPAQHYTAQASLMCVVNVDEVQSRAARTVLVDARAPERYRGEVEPIDAVAGHIPGAINRFWQANLADIAQGRFKSASELRQEFSALLSDRSPQEFIAYCGSGVTACHQLLAMAHAGLPGAALYAGSWSEWIADPARPVARGHG